MKTTRVTGKRQVTVPAEVARKYHIEPGSRLDWLDGEREDEIRIRVLPGPSELLRQVREIGAKYADRVPDSAEVLRRIREEDDPDEAGTESGSREDHA